MQASKRHLEPRRNTKQRCETSCDPLKCSTGFADSSRKPSGVVRLFAIPNEVCVAELLFSSRQAARKPIPIPMAVRGSLPGIQPHVLRRGR